MWLVYDWYFCKSIQIPQHFTCFLRFQIRHLRINNDAPTGQGFDSLKESFNTTAEQPAKGLSEKVSASYFEELRYNAADLEAKADKANLDQLHEAT